MSSLMFSWQTSLTRRLLLCAKTHDYIRPFFHVVSFLALVLAPMMPVREHDTVLLRDKASLTQASIMLHANCKPVSQVARY